MVLEAHNNGRNLRVVVVPWLAFGHLIPFYELSKALARRGHKIIFISTPRNIARLPKLPDDLISSIDFLEIPLPKIDGLPENAEATMDVRGEEVQYLKAAYDGLEGKIVSLLEESRADVVLCDFAPYWLPPIAKKLGIFCIFFSTFNAWLFAFLGSTESLIRGLDDRKKPEDFVVTPNWIDFSTKLAYKLYEARWVVEEAAITNASGVSDTYRAGKVIENSDAILIRHCNEFEPKWLNLLEVLHNKQVIPLGLMLPEIRETIDPTWDSIENWLSTQKEGSVLYVAVGSEVMLSRAQMNELAHGLELSGLPFFFALRKPAGSSETDVIELPDGFEERNKGRGVVWKQWSPQLKILEHESVGAFLTHCGWSSIVEGLMFGKPFVLLPFHMDQGLNARVLSENDLGMEVDRNEEDGSYSRDAVAETIRIVLVDEKGQRFRDKAREARAVFGDRDLHQDYVEKFIDYMEEKA